jgi:two-component system, LytTR family, response regulator LytT
MSMLKVVIIEDEKRTAQELASVLKMVDDDIDILSILSSVKQANDYFKTENHFDLIISDIQLTDGLSFEIFKNIKISVPVIFCTAYDKYALEAFKTNTIDYILKPFDKDSVAKALEKYQTLKSNFSSTNDNLENLFKKLEERISPSTSKSNSIVISRGDKIIPIKTQEIALFYHEDDFVFALTFDQKKHIISQTLEELESACGYVFFRANRQYLINRKAVKDASRYFNRKLLVNLNFNYPEEITISRLKATQFIEWLAKN